MKVNITREVTTPARRNLIYVEGESPLLEEHEAFQSIVAKLLYVLFGACLDMLLPVAFLCTQATKIKRQDHTKLERVLDFVKEALICFIQW